MITKVIPRRAIYLLLLIPAGFIACQKDVSSNGTSTSSTIAVAASESAAATGTTVTDSVYIVQPCARGSQRVAITESDLPAAVTAYLAANYSGYTFNKAFAVKNSDGAITAYVAVIFYNGKPVGILFDSSGNFVRVLEQRERGDIDGGGWHEGGRFCDRNGLQRDTIALAALPASILVYMATNYPQDTLVKAFVNHHDSSYVVLSRNNGLFANLFDAAGNFIRRVTLPAPPGLCVSVAKADLPPAILNYLSNSYPNYVFEKAFAVYRDNTLQGYLVVIDANNTKYAVRFDASGNFVSVRTIC